MCVYSIIVSSVCHALVSLCMQEFQNAERGAEAKWGAVPAWKQKLLREK